MDQTAEKVEAAMPEADEAVAAYTAVMAMVVVLMVAGMEEASEG